MERSSHCPKYRLRFGPNLSVRPARQSPHHAVDITGCPSCGGQRTHSASRMRPTELRQSSQLPVAQINSPAVRPSAASARGHLSKAALPSLPPKVSTRGAPGLLRVGFQACFAQAPLRDRAAHNANPARAGHLCPPGACSRWHKLKRMSTALKSAPNRSVEATSNGWPHRASCSFLALCGQPSAAPHLLR
jgi:hypothetical protein